VDIADAEAEGEAAQQAQRRRSKLKQMVMCHASRLSERWCCCLLPLQMVFSLLLRADLTGAC
jgi:hypothetical protein